MCGRGSVRGRGVCVLLLAALPSQCPVLVARQSAPPRAGVPPPSAAALPSSRTFLVSQCGPTATCGSSSFCSRSLTYWMRFSLVAPMMLPRLPM